MDSNDRILLLEEASPDSTDLFLQEITGAGVEEQTLLELSQTQSPGLLQDTALGELSGDFPDRLKDSANRELLEDKGLISAISEEVRILETSETTSVISSRLSQTVPIFGEDWNSIL